MYQESNPISIFDRNVLYILSPLSDILFRSFIFLFLIDLSAKGLTLRQSLVELHNSCSPCPFSFIRHPFIYYRSLFLCYHFKWAPLFLFDITYHSFDLVIPKFHHHQPIRPLLDIFLDAVSTPELIYLNGHRRFFNKCDWSTATQAW